MAKENPSRALTSFHENIADAHALTRYWNALSNGTVDSGEDHSPLLRQTVMAGCAALETFIVDTVMACLGPAISEMPKQLAKLPITLGEAHAIIHAAKDGTEQPGLGIRKLLKPKIERETSTNPKKIAKVMGFVGQSDVMASVDKLRDVPANTTDRELLELSQRRNGIAHSLDRAETGRKRKPITIDEVEEYLRVIEEIASAFERLLRDRVGMARNSRYPNWDRETLLAAISRDDFAARPAAEDLLDAHDETVDHWDWSEKSRPKVSSIFNEGTDTKSIPYTIVAASPARFDINFEWMTKIPEARRQALLQYLIDADLCPPDADLTTIRVPINITEALADSESQKALLRAIEVAVEPRGYEARPSAEEMVERRNDDAAVSLHDTKKNTPTRPRTRRSHHA